jgi:hypothetical protein
MEDACPVRECGERFDSEVYACFLPSGRQWLYWYISAGKACIPAIGFSADRDRLGHSLQWAAPTDGDAPDLRQDQEAIVEPGATVVSNLRIGEAVVASTPMEARIAWCLSSIQPAEERLKRTLYAQHHILQDLGVDLGILRQRLLDAR